MDILIEVGSLDPTRDALWPHFRHAELVNC